ncbi:serine/threonine protein phosphatase [Pseudanabaena sp. FACHB-1998]|uniref:metallophosphoesterase family protein n=1 Tax=Pseudanabaena sp. FACHB-1998 TaxID=2692858 RepID=UPI0016814B51|nr:metallophosphoesterase family protein [Pseudanabaena sp. FACHB-1998]MBD2177207.1 serine/threonine protein phosphatase [Pseudanabaena sp. FACHB-1998]
MTRYVFGDIHGQFDGLMKLVEFIKCSPNDKLFFLGDLIDRGNRSADVVKWVIENGHTCLRGNHEQMCLEAYSSTEGSLVWKGWLLNGGCNTIESYGKDGMPNDHLEWMQQLPLYVDLGDAWLVHAGLNPNIPLELQGSAEFCWIREEFHSTTEPFFDNKIIITGHTITFVFPGVKPGNLVLGKGWLDIDTGAYHPKSGWMTALDLDSATVYQCNTFTNELRVNPLSEITTVIEPMPTRSQRQEAIKATTPKRRWSWV